MPFFHHLRESSDTIPRKVKDSSSLIVDVQLGN